MEGITKDGRVIEFKFLDTKRFSPIIYDQEFPSKDDPNFENWWIEQYKFCTEGYTIVDAIDTTEEIYIEDIDLWVKDRIITITGKHYFYLNFWPIYALDEDLGFKTKRPPKFIDLDFEKFYMIERMFKEEKDNLFFKSRQKGFSEFIACIIGWFFTFIPASQCVIVAGMSDYNEHTMENVINGLDALIETEFYKNRKPNRADYIRATEVETIITPEGFKRTKVTGFKSEVYSISAKDNPQAVSRLTPTFIVYEEVGKWKKGLLPETVEFVKASLKAEGKKTGYQVFIGTGGDMEEGVYDVEEMFYDPESNDLLTFKNKHELDYTEDMDLTANFIPAWKFEVIDTEGNSLKAESITSIELDRSKKKGAKKYRAITQKPFYPSEGFMITTGGYFGKDVSEALNRRLSYLNTHKSEQIGVYGNLEWIDPKDWSKGCIFKPGPDEEGKAPFFIIERPQKDDNDQTIQGLYNGATDSYDRDEANSSISKGSCGIFKGYEGANKVNRTWVARVTERPDEGYGSAKIFYEMTAKLCMYYAAPNLIEYSNLNIFDWYETHKIDWILRERPSFVISNWLDSKVANRYGIDPATKKYWLVELKDYLVENNYANIDNMFDVQQLKALARFVYDPSGKKFNCDITISTALNIVHNQDNEKYIEEPSSQDNEKKPFYHYSIGNGNKIVQSFYR